MRKTALLAGFALLLSGVVALAQSITPTGNAAAPPCTAFGTAAGTCAQGNDSRITGAVQATVACTPWTPTDQSGASLTFTAVSAQYCQYGNIVIVYGTLTYPTTADGSNAKISLPVVVPNQPYASVFGTADGQGHFIKTVINSSTAAIQSAGGVATTNAILSTKIINIFVVYPAS